MMRVLQDSSFLVSFINSADVNHEAAVESVAIISKYKVELVFSHVVLNETLFTLVKSGLKADLVRASLNELVNIESAILTTADLFSTPEYFSYNYVSMLSGIDNQNGISKTNDYIIVCQARANSAFIISSDKQMVTTLNTAGQAAFNFTSEVDRDILTWRLQQS